MASIKISNLPVLSAGTLTDDDQFVINDANQTTSRLSYLEFKTDFLGGPLTFAGSVNFDGDINIVESLTSNVPTKTQVTAEIETVVARDLGEYAKIVAPNFQDSGTGENITRPRYDGSPLINQAILTDKIGVYAKIVAPNFQVDETDPANHIRPRYAGSEIINRILLDNAIKVETDRSTAAEGVLTTAVSDENVAMLAAVKVNYDLIVPAATRADQAFDNSASIQTKLAGLSVDGNAYVDAGAPTVGELQAVIAALVTDLNAALA